ncbi:MAG: sugar phosphate isomerase/epimerase [Phycisphaeraceae bacterium]|nr:sugar phosphate isomerase/epimerase [Phycisphaerae bacterium]MBX3392628.1 sugar phosphate isomerase/epimerase [Phycisphaeraceae bacterium]
MHETSRRDFLLTSATAAMAATGLSAGPAHSSSGPARGEPSLTPAPAPVLRDGPRTLRKAAMIGMVGEGETALEKFQILRDCGFEGVEMDCPSPTPIDDMLDAQEKTGLKIHGLVDSVHWKWHLNSPSEQVRQRGREALEQCLREGRQLGASSVLLVPAVVNAQQPYDQAWTLTIEEIRRVLPLARETGVQIAVENVWNNFLLSPLEAARYVDELNDPFVRFHFDIGNVINFGYPPQWIRILGQRLVKLHIKDFSRKKRDDEGLWKGFSVELGDGDAGWHEVMKALDHIGYSTDPAGRWATAEVGGGDRSRLRQVSDQMDRLFSM